MPVTPTAAKTVVVADDTAYVRDRFRVALEGAGHRAITAGSAPELVRIVRAEMEQLDLVVLDLQLPHAHGTDVLRALRQIHPSLPAVVVFSGTIANADEVRALAELRVAGYVNEYTSGQHIMAALAPYLFPDDHNRRAGPRGLLGIPVSYRVGTTIASGVTLNISRGGLAVRTTSPLARDTIAKLRFRLPGGSGEIEAEARVSWSDRRLGMGLQFTTITPASEQAVHTFVDAHFFSNRKA